MRIRSVGLLLTLMFATACSREKPGDAVAEPGRSATAQTTASAPSSRVASTASPVVTTSAEAVSDAASLARPETITFGVLFSFPRRAQVDAVANGVIACDGDCRTSSASHPDTMWFVDRTRVVENHDLQPWSATLSEPSHFSFGGTYPDALYAALTVFGDRSGFEIGLKFDGKLYQSATPPPKTFDYLAEAKPTPEVLAELELTSGSPGRQRVAFGAGGPPMVFDDRGARAKIDGKLEKLTFPGRLGDVRAVHRLKNGYTVVVWPKRVAVLDVRGKPVSLRVEGKNLEPDLESGRYGGAALHFVDGEIWISLVLDLGTPSTHTVLVAAPPKLLAPLHLESFDAAITSLLNGVMPGKTAWAPSAPPAPTRPAP